MRNIFALIAVMVALAGCSNTCKTPVVQATSPVVVEETAPVVTTTPVLTPKERVNRKPITVPPAPLAY
jgi:hypothetical protein